MIKLKKGNKLVFGLSDENMKRLKSGEPIKFNLSELGMEDTDVYIFNGKDERTMYEMFKDTIDPFKTIMKDSRADQN